MTNTAPPSPSFQASQTCIPFSKSQVRIVPSNEQLIIRCLPGTCKMSLTALVCPSILWRGAVMIAVLCVSSASEDMISAWTSHDAGDNVSPYLQKLPSDLLTCASLALYENCNGVDVFFDAQSGQMGGRCQSYRCVLHAVYYCVCITALNAGKRPRPVLSAHSPFPLTSIIAIWCLAIMRVQISSPVQYRPWSLCFRHSRG